MENNDKTRLFSIMNGVAINFSSSIPDGLLDLMFKTLKEFTIEQIEQAAIIILKTRKFTKMPTIADFHEAIEGSIEDKAEIQAGVVFDAIIELGSYNPPGFYDPITEDIVKNKMNWCDLCRLSVADLNFKMKEFRQMYKSYKKVESNPLLNAPDKIKGLLENMTKRIE